MGVFKEANEGEFVDTTSDDVNNEWSAGED